MERAGSRVPTPDSVGVQQAVMMHLLKGEGTFVSARELARRLGFGHSKVAEVIRFLEFHQAVRLDEGGRWIADWEKVARLLGALRLGAVVPAKTIEAARVQHEVRGRLEASGVAHVFAFTTAANALAYFEPQPETCLYVEKRRVAEAVEILRGVSASGSRRSEQRSRGLARRPSVLLFAERLAVLDTAASKIGTITSLHQTYVDLLHYPLAGAQADFLKKAIERQKSRSNPAGAREGSP